MLEQLEAPLLHTFDLDFPQEKILATPLILIAK